MGELGQHGNSTHAGQTLRNSLFLGFSIRYDLVNKLAAMYATH